MHKFWSIFTHEIISLVWRPSYLIGVIGIPLLSIVMYGLLNLLKPPETGSADAFAFPGLASMNSLQSMESLDGLKELVAPPEDTHLPLGFVDLAGVTRLVPEYVDVSAYEIFNSQAEAQAALDGGLVRAYYLFPADFVRSGQVLYYASVVTVARAVSLDDGLNDWVRYNLADGDMLAVDASQYPFISVEETNLDPANAPHFDMSDFDSLMPVIMIFYFQTVLLVLSSSMIFASFNNESSNRVMEVLLVSTSAEQVLWGKFAALTLIGFLQIILWVCGMAAFGAEIKDSFYVQALNGLSLQMVGWMLLFNSLSFTFFGALMLGMASRFPYLREGSQVMYTIMMPLMMPLLMLYLLAQTPNHWLLVLLSLFPLTAPTSILLRMLVTEVPLWQLILSAVLLLVSTLGMVRFMARNFRPAHLLSSQKFEWFKRKGLS